MPDLALNAKTIYILAAVIGGAILSLQMILLLFGFDSDHDFDGGDLDHSDGFGFLSVRGIASFLTFFGLTGWYGLERGWGTGKSTLLGLAAGMAMMLFVLWVMAMQSKLHQEGNVDPEGALGKSATVYLRIPGENQGKGKITVSIQDRTHEYNAVTKGPELATGSEVRVVKRLTENTFEVEALEA